MSLETLAHYNERRERSYKTRWAGKIGDMSMMNGNGLACPECGQQLVDTRPFQMAFTKPPSLHVHCKGCGHEDRRAI